LVYVIKRWEATMRRILRRRGVEQLVGLGRSQIYSLMETRLFPKQIKLGPRAVGWVEEEIEAWIEERIGERDK
jgi:prophage regulatory protein